MTFEFKKIRFTVTDDHLKLLRRANVTWDSCEFGAPAIDCKRPYGNSSVPEDIHMILTGEPVGYRAVENDELTIEQIDKYKQIHRQTRTALQIALAVGYFKAGVYECRECHRDWEPVA